MQHWRITGNSNVAIQTGSTYISDSMADITTTPTANLGFSTTPSATGIQSTRHTVNSSQRFFSDELTVTFSGSCDELTVGIVRMNKRVYWLTNRSIKLQTISNTLPVTYYSYRCELVVLPSLWFACVCWTYAHLSDYIVRWLKHF